MTREIATFSSNTVIEGDIGLYDATPTICSDSTFSALRSINLTFLECFWRVCFNNKIITDESLIDMFIPNV